MSRARILRRAWALPGTLAGLLVAVPALLYGASWQRVDGVLEVSLAGERAASRRTRLPFDAITLGHVVLGRDRAALARLRAHERVHVAQYERWGLLFFLAYPLAGLWQWLRGRHPYRDNPFEVEARARSGEAGRAPRT